MSRGLSRLRNIFMGISQSRNMPSEKTIKFVDDKIGSGKKVVMFSKTYCPFCTKAKTALKNYNLSDDLEIIEIENLPDCGDIQEYLGKLTGGKSVPRVFVNGKFLGGGDETAAAHSSGQLKTMLA